MAVKTNLSYKETSKTKKEAEGKKQVKNAEIYEKAANSAWMNDIVGRTQNPYGVYNAMWTTNGLLITHRDPKTGELWAENKARGDGQLGCWIPGDSVRLERMGSDSNKDLVVK